MDKARSHFARIAVLMLCLAASANSLADALMVNRSVSSSSIAQYYIKEDGVRVELQEERL